MNIHDKNSTEKAPSPDTRFPNNSVNEGSEKASIMAAPASSNEPGTLPVCDKSMYASPCNDPSNVWSYHRTSDRSMSAMHAGLW